MDRERGVEFVEGGAEVQRSRLIITGELPAAAPAVAVARMGCHDGVNATDGGAGGAHMGDSARNHPVGVRYPRSGTEDTDTSYRPVYQPPREVRLPRGTVSCVSCHNVYSGKPSLLAVTLEGSALCFTCHQMD